MNGPWRTESKRNVSSAFYEASSPEEIPQCREVFLDTRSHTPGWGTSSRFVPSFPTEDTYERRIIVDKEEVTLIVYDIWEQVRTKMCL